MDRLTSANNETPAFITPGTCPPDLANGDFIAFDASNSSKTFCQITNNSDIWFKVVTEEGIVSHQSVFMGESAKMLLRYFQQREKSIQQAAGAKIEKEKKYPQVKWFDATESFPPKEVDAEEGEQNVSVDVLVYTKDGSIINAWFDYERSGWYCFGVGKQKGKEEHLTDVQFWCLPPVLPNHQALV